MNRIMQKWSTLMAPGKYFRVLAISLATGLVLTMLQYFLPTVLFYGAKEWTPSMTHTSNMILAAASAVLFLGSGFFSFQDMAPWEIALSALTFSAYMAVLLVLEWFVKSVLHFYPPILMYFMVPCALPMEPSYLLHHYWGAPLTPSFAWLCASLTAMAYVVFGHRKKER